MGGGAGWQVGAWMEQRDLSTRESFKRLDANGDKALAADELWRGLTHDGLALSLASAQRLVALHRSSATGAPPR